MNLDTTRFGSVAYDAKDEIQFPAGLFEDCQDGRWLLLADQSHPSLYWLQSLTHADRAVAVCAISDGIASRGIRLYKTNDLPDWVSQTPVVALAPLTGGADDIAILLTQPVLIDPRTRQGTQAQANVDQTLQREWSEKVAPLRECA